MYPSLLEQVLIAMKENRPAMFHRLNQDMCRHTDATRDDDENLIHCSDCGKTETESAT
jgi:hypothetical protein